MSESQGGGEIQGPMIFSEDEQYVFFQDTDADKVALCRATYSKPLFSYVCHNYASSTCNSAGLIILC